MSRFSYKRLEIKEVLEINHHPISDKRGFLSRIFCIEEINKFSKFKEIKQINRTFTNKKGSIRGLHFQYPPASETKIIICTKGQIFDVALDIRKNSKTYLEHVSIILNSDLNNMVLIPKGFAHGFQTLTDNVELIYLHDYEYSPKFESGLNPFDQLLKIDWPLQDYSISQKDFNSKSINEKKFQGII
nr:dTDP-4-dehydrorhamnose 3,5-epimerase family protein [Prochlorococcus marinus]